MKIYGWCHVCREGITDETSGRCIGTGHAWTTVLRDESLPEHEQEPEVDTRMRAMCEAFRRGEE